MAKNHRYMTGTELLKKAASKMQTTPSSILGLGQMLHGRSKKAP